MLQRSLLAALFLAITLATRADCAVECFATTDCLGDRISPNGAATARQCCTGSDASMAYKEQNQTECKPCIVHGFSMMNYEVEEGEMAGIVFKKNVKGTSVFSSLDLLLLGTITSEDQSADKCDYVDIGKVETDGEGPTDITVVTINDDVALEYHDKVMLNFEALHGERFVKELESAGEFLRATAYLGVLDNDDFEINFQEMNYELPEASGASDVVFQHRKAQGRFTLTVRTLDMEQLQQMREAMGGDRRRGPSRYPATKGADFVGDRDNSTMVVKDSTFPELVAKDLIIINDDDYNENPEVFFVVAAIEPEYELTNTKICFKRNENDQNCTNHGVAIVTIIDDDPVSIGFARKTQTVLEVDAQNIIEIESNVESQRPNLLKVDLLFSKSTAVVKPAGEADAYIYELTGDADSELTHTFAAGSRLWNISVHVEEDNLMEGEECFYLRVSPEDSHRHEFVCNKEEEGKYFCEHKFCIKEVIEGEVCVLEFAVEEFTIKENETATVCVNLNCPVNRTNVVEVEVYSDDSTIIEDELLVANGTYPTLECRYSHGPYDDYEKQIRGCNLMQGMTIEEGESKCYDQSVIDDDRLETTEYTGLALHLKSFTAYTLVHEKPATIEIVDNDFAVVSLEHNSYVVEEGQVVEVCAIVASPEIECPVNFEFYVKIQTFDDDAESGDDYLPVNRILRFDPCEKRRCVNISTVQDDCFLERTEEFIVLLDKMEIGSEIGRISIELDEAKITVIDDDKIYVHFQRDYPRSVDESVGVVELFLFVGTEDESMTCSYDFDFTVSVITAQGTAHADKDYTSFSKSIMFTGGNLVVRVPVEILEDKTVETHREEYFFVHVASGLGQPPSIKPVDKPANITIVDNDISVFGLEKPTCTVEENMIFSVCVVLKSPTEGYICPVEFQFDVQFTVSDESSSSGDHDAVSTILEFYPCSARQCKNITIYSDLSLEPDERFTISLEPLYDDYRIPLIDTEKEVIIEDNDFVIVDFKEPGVGVEEGEKMEVCLSITGRATSTCPSSVPIDIVVRTQEGTAKARSDYEYFARIIEIGACQIEACFDIVLIDDFTVEKAVEEFTVLLSHGVNEDLNDRIRIPNPTKMLSILDVDYADVEFTMSTVTVAETAEVAEACVTVAARGGQTDCPVDHAFNVSFYTIDGSAVASSDYVPKMTTITFPECGERQCVSLTINDDCEMENDEIFYGMLERPGSTAERVVVSSELLIVNITDSDRLIVRLERTFYVFSEGDGDVKVCAVIISDCKPSAPFRIKFRTRPDTAEVDGPSADYIPVTNHYLRFTPTRSRDCATIRILDDVQVEQPQESFYVSIEEADNTPERVILAFTEAEVVISDDDKAIMMFNETTYMVDEDDLVVVLCVEITDPAIDHPVVYPIEFVITTTPETAQPFLDYIPPTRNFRYGARLKQDCFEIAIVNDLVLEKTESFNVTLSFETGRGNAIVLEGSTARIKITDDDQAMISFIKTIYTVNEEQGMVVVCAVVENDGPDPIINFPFSVTLSTSPVTATTDVDYVKQNKTVMEFAAGIEKACQLIPIVEDCILEELEIFDIELDTVEGVSENIKIGKGDGDVRITDTKPIYIDIEEPGDTIEGSPLVEVCVVIRDGCVSTSEFYINFKTVNNSADSPDDYIAVDIQLVFEPMENKKCVIIFITDDRTLEQQESFSVTIEKPLKLHDLVQIGISSREIVIGNDDDATVGMEEATYTTDEGIAYFEICVTITDPEIECPVIFPFDLMFVANNPDRTDTAIAGEDYRITENILRFGACEKKQCLPVTIIDNDIIEDAETFQVTLAPSTLGLSNRFTLEPRITTVTIEDGDMAIVTFDRLAYTVQETSGSPRVCIRVVAPTNGCPVNAEFSVTLIVLETQNSAREDEDFSVTETAMELEFARCRTVVCVFPFTIINDLKVEDVETFDIFIQSEERALVRADPNIAEVTILDGAERATVELTERSYTVTEGTDRFLFVCASITTAPDETCPVDFAFEVTLDVGGDEFDMAFAKCQREKCLPVPIINDNKIENTETVRISLIRPTELDRRIRVSSRRAILTIIDDPNDFALVGLERAQYVFEEEDTETDVCVRVTYPAVDSPIAFSFSVMLTSTDGTAMSRTDYSNVAVRLFFNPGDLVKCQRVRLIDDRTQENNERFTITLSGTAGTDPRIQFLDAEASIQIIDTDPVEVGLERSAYTVREDVGHVEVCVVVTSPTSGCPVAYNFSVLVVNLAGSAVPGSDYANGDSTTRLVFGRCDRKHCASIRIIDNEVLEDSEMFSIRLFRNGLDDYFSVSRQSATVVITDDDDITVGFSQTQYRVEENGGMIRVCAELKTDSTSCVVPFSFFLTFTTRDGNADSPEDFIAVSDSLRLSHCTSEVCAFIPIVNDIEVEGTERFTVTLSGENLDQRITLRPTVATVSINDDDSVRVFINESRYFVSEGEGSVAVCVEVDSPRPVREDCPVDFRITVTLVATPDSADTSDYRPSSVRLSIPECGTSACGRISIVDDNILETAVETFIVSLADTNTDSRLRVVSDVFSTVDIRDNDEVTIGMTQMTYTVAEGRQQSVCVTLNGRSAIDNSVKLTTRQDTAETGDPSDFTSISETLTFTPSSSTSNQLCVDVETTDDSVVEETEQFFVELMRAQGLDRRATLIDTATTSEIFITDNDNARIKLNASSLSVTEGDTFQLCVLVNDNAAECGVAYDFDVTLTVPPYTPNSDLVKPEDYDGVTEVMTIRGCRNRMCVPVTIVDDRIVESEEKLVITLSENIRAIVDSSRADNRVEITIHDNDNAFVRLYQDYQYVREDIGTASVCAVVDASQAVAFRFEVNFIFTTDSATADDFVVEDSVAVFRPEDIVPGRMQKGCAELTIINSVAVEMPESLGVRIELPAGTPDVIQLTPSMTEGTIDIFDDDSAVVGLTSNDYTFGTDSVRICVCLTEPSGDCPITFPFDLVFRLAPETSAIFEVDTNSFSDGEGIDREGAQDYILLFDSCQRKFCFEINLKDGIQRPESGSFGISVARTPDHGRSTTLNPKLTLGNIIVG